MFEARARVFFSLDSKGARPPAEVSLVDNFINPEKYLESTSGKTLILVRSESNRAQPISKTPLLPSRTPMAPVAVACCWVRSQPFSFGKRLQTCRYIPKVLNDYTVDREIS